MVKADVRRDYYADLGLTPSADAEDVKRQFRKLALKYHPDRNPGRELEFNAKFQAIQAANEILSDSHQRLKYDTDRLRAGYGKFYGPPRANTSRKTPTNPYASTPNAKPQPPKPQFSGRPQSFHNGPSTGAQRFASYARAAPRQPWEKMQDDGQTRADAYRGFQDMKGNSTPGWSQFDPRTGRAGYSGAAPRPDGTPNKQSSRPKSAYEYFKTSPKATGTEPSPRTQSTRKKQGFAPRTAGGDEPMAPHTSSYTNAPRRERFQASDPVFEAAPSPTAKKTATPSDYRTESTRTPDFERTSSRYAGTGGEKTFFSSSWLGHESRRNSPEDARDHSRTTPPSPTPAPSGRHQSASPKLRKNRSHYYDSTSSSGTDDNAFVSRKPKATPKSRVRNQKFSHFRSQANLNHENEGHNSAGAASDETPSTRASTSKTAHDPGSFKSSSHDDLRRPFAAGNWSGDFGFGSFSPDVSIHSPNGRGRASARASPTRAGQAGGDQSRSASASQQPPTPFAEAKFLADDWAAKLKDLKFAMPNHDEARQQAQANTQRQRSPRKQTRAGAKLRPTPQPASVATEAEESRATVGGDSKQETADANDEEAEAMDLDDEVPGANVEAAPTPEQGSNGSAKEMPPPPSQPSTEIPSSDAAFESKTRLFNLNDLGTAAPFTSTNSGGIDDLEDIHTTLPFESHPTAPRTTIRDVRPRQLVCPNPPKRPTAPVLVPISAGLQQLGLPRAAWERYVAEMNAYMREWNTFNRRLLHHFNARQEAMETGMTPNWIGAVGDSARLKIDELLDGEEDGQECQENVGHESDGDVVAGNAKAGYSAYLRALDEDERVQKHWEVAREMHRECIVKLGQMRQWILNGGKLI